MARPGKSGLEYFPLDVTESDEIVLLEAETGLVGHMIFIKLLKAIYDEGYYLVWTEMRKKLFSHRINADINTVSEVINVCLSVDLFNREVYEKYDILTSRGIQKRYFTAVNRRKKVYVNNNYLLVDINVYINPKSEVVYEYINPQSKVKREYTRLEEKEKEEDSFPPPENVTKNYTVEEPEDDMPGGDILTESIAEWNSRSPPLPRYRYLSPNLGVAEGVGRTITAYSKPEIFKAIENYAEIIGDRVQYKPNPEYTGLPGFLAKGVEKYADDAYPFDRCRFRSFQDADAEAEKKRQERIMANLGIGGFDDG